ncbi:hypothetical protein CTI12_AA257760 [Artemisia annua]|uniref:Plastid movement impaired 2 n=1 Tax=Artemisia annua TaxID=35608 RepID=A0A2U1NK43_ARTAN|nr:hypothetical protein CTI12_AA257760 [Artemisia annua]
MGNSLGSRKKTTKIMKVNGETIKFKTPVNAAEVIKDYPGLVLLDSEMVKHYGVRAKPLEPQEHLKAKRIYFLVELPKLAEENKPTRRVRSGINMSAKDRLESLALARRSASDITFMKAPPSMMVENGEHSGGLDPYRVKLRLPKAEVERLMKESKDETEAAERIMRLCMEKNGGRGSYSGDLSSQRRHVQFKDDASREGSNKGRGKRVGFLPVSQELTAEDPTWLAMNNQLTKISLHNLSKTRKFVAMDMFSTQQSPKLYCFEPVILSNKKHRLMFKDKSYKDTCADTIIASELPITRCLFAPTSYMITVKRNLAMVKHRMILMFLANRIETIFIR